ncbi:AAA family ATPase [Xanthocytophaga flava]|uniref:AAA family ATPase n=1 Tax=Xanthocytophaga flava TaxID=3048013 RepID=UPI0028D594E8|nr:AAA family ATPase [Xanthocytophaga flavus]MDJ1468684.1 AAA family ATPase [Xanthocytophaga flavus]
MNQYNTNHQNTNSNEFHQLVNQFREGRPVDFSMTQPKPERKRSIDIDFTYQARNRKPAIRIHDVDLISKGEILSVIGAPGAGKSNLVEDIVAGFVSHITHTPYPNPLIGFHYEAATPQSRMVLFDFERSTDDVAKSLGRIFRRTGMDENLLKDNQLYNVRIRSQIELGTLEERRDDIRLFLQEAIDNGEPYDYLILDGCLDLTTNMNDPEGAPEAVRWIRTLTAEFNLATICTLHPNKNSETAAGHFGTFLHRWSRAFLLLKKVPMRKGLRMLTSEFDLGKLSHSSDSVERYFIWNKERRFFTAIDAPIMLPSQPNPNHAPKLQQIIEKIFTKRMTTEIPAVEFKKLMLEASGENESKVKRLIAQAVEFGYVRVSGGKKAAIYHLVTIP